MQILSNIVCYCTFSGKMILFCTIAQRTRFCKVHDDVDLNKGPRFSGSQIDPLHQISTTIFCSRYYATHTRGFGLEKWKQILILYLIPPVKYGGGSLMLWGYFTSTGLGALAKFNSIMNFDKYQDILAHHTKSTKKWLTDHNINILQLPSQSLDSNPIEHLWF
jgi:hypothetical protein